MNDSYETWEDVPEGEQEAAEVAPTVTAPAPYSAPWTWSTNSILIAAGAILAVSFGAWFLMSFNAAKARALAETVAENE